MPGEAGMCDPFGVGHQRRLALQRTGERRIVRRLGFPWIAYRYQSFSSVLSACGIWTVQTVFLLYIDLTAVSSSCDPSVRIGIQFSAES